MLTFPDLRRSRVGAVVPPPSQRKNQSVLSPTEQARFLDAISTLNQRRSGVSIYGRLVSIHADMSHDMHNMDATGQQRFLPWHRVYLYQLEQQLQRIHPDVAIPYWDWTEPAEQAIPGWLQEVTLTVDVPAPGPGTVVVTRSPGTADQLSQVVQGAQCQASLVEVTQMTDYTDFAGGLECIHDGVHEWVGGTMSILDTAPADPLFWMHHANIDRLWWGWQTGPSGTGQNPVLSGSAAIMDPWPVDETQTRDLANFNYVYV